MSETTKYSPMRIHLLMADGKELRLGEADENGRNYIALRAPAALSENYSLTLPSVPPSGGQTLVYDGNGNLTWAAGVGGATAHNDLDGLQGGSGNERYHLTQIQWANAVAGISVDSDKLDGKDGSYYAVSTHNHSHNSLNDLQGGSADEYYHLTAIEYGEIHPEVHGLTSADHTVSSLTPGTFLKALSASTFGFVAHGLAYGDVGAAALAHTHAHNDLTSIQGGSANEYYHLTAAQHFALGPIPSAASTVSAETSYGISSNAGSVSTYSKGDHTHGTPPPPTWAQVDKSTSSIADITTRSAAALSSGTLDGDRLPALSATKRGGVPMTGTPSNKFLRDDDSWQAAGSTPALAHNDIFVGNAYSVATDVPLSGDVTVGFSGTDPLGMAGLLAWWKADAIIGLVDGDPVSSWLDSSGNGNTAFQVNAPSCRPIYKTGLLGGKPGLRFSNPNQTFLSLTSIMPNVVSAFIVTKFHSPIAYASPFGWNGSSNYDWCADAGGTLWFGTYTCLNIKNGTGCINGAPTAILSMAEDYVNYQIMDVVAAGNTHVGEIGRLQATGYYAVDSDILEIILFSVALSNADRQMLQGYAAWKYGIQAYLPVGHPYRSSSPTPYCASSITAGVIVDADISAGAAIAFSKLASMSDGYIVIGDSTGIPTQRAVSGDVTISDTGATSITAGAVVNSMVGAAAAIDYSKIGPYHLPAADGTLGQFLQTNGAATLAWTSNLGGLASISSPVTVGGTGTETKLKSADIPGGYLRAQSTLRITARGVYSSKKTTPGTLTFNIRWGAGDAYTDTQIATWAFTPAVDMSGKYWSIDALVTVATATTAIAKGLLGYVISALATAPTFLVDSAIAAQTIAPASESYLGLYAVWQTSDVANTLTCSNLAIECVRV